MNFNKKDLSKIGGPVMFIGRTKELIALEDVYNKKGFGMTVIYGRRRIGKSTLIREFCSL